MSADPRFRALAHLDFNSRAAVEVFGMNTEPPGGDLYNGILDRNL
jgi:hypothetical protein